jgi:hypothetical protein
LNGTLFLLLGAVSCGVASALFCAFATRTGDRHLARMTAAAVVACLAAALYFAWQLP